MKKTEDDHQKPKVGMDLNLVGPCSSPRKPMAKFRTELRQQVCDERTATAATRVTTGGALGLGLGREIDGEGRRCADGLDAAEER